MDFDRLNRKLEGLSNASQKGFRVRNLYEILRCKELWYVAYANIYSNQGALTKGVDEITLDAMSKERIENIINAINSKKYKPKPVRRTYIPKKDGSKRPLGVPSGNDKLVQAVIKILLESIYEPVFSNNSHGFRPNKSCHTAIEQIKHQWKGVKWFVEFDIKGFFDNVNHAILITSLEKKIDDKRFIKLIKSFLRAGYIEDFVYNITYSGTPQGGIISPILSNIYLHELDIFMDSLINQFDKGKKRPKNHEYNRISLAIGRIRKQLRKKGSTPERIKELTALQIKQRELSSVLENTEEYKRLRYCRYADDFVCGVIGSYENAKEIMQTIKDFLQNLGLNLSEEKTGIVRSTKNIDFLGYNICHSTRLRERKIKVKGTYTLRRTHIGIVLSIPKSKVIGFCNKYDYGDWQSKKATHRGKLITSSDAEIISTYNAELRGLANYYSLANNHKYELNALFNLAHYSMFKTLAGKRKCSVKQVLQSMTNYSLKVKVKDDWKEFQMFQLKHINKSNKGATDNLPVTEHLYKSGTEMIKRMEAKSLRILRNNQIQIMKVHHVHKLKDLKSRKHLELWEKVMIARNRKTMILCVECHNLLHHGKLPDKRFKPKNA